jgi:tellurite resistance protein TerC
MRVVKKAVVAIMGGTVLAIGIVMIVLPGPAVLVIPAGLAILATEFVWAQRWLDKAKGMCQRWKERRAKKSSVPIQGRV